VTNTAIVTKGSGAVGVGAYGGTTTTLNGGSVSTSGYNSFGVLANGSGAIISVSGTNVSTTGVDAFAVGAQGGAAVTISGGSAATIGNAAKGLIVNGTGSSLAASDLTVTTSGTIDPATGFHAYAVFNGAASGTSYTSGGALLLTNVTAKTSGADAAGVVTSNGGTTTINGGSITTTGLGADALDASSGATVKLTGTNLMAQNNGSNGIAVSGATLTASGITVTANGASVPATNTYVFGVDTLAAGTTTLSGGSVSTTGVEAAGVASHGTGTAVALSGTTISTIGDASQGLQVLGTGSSLTASNLRVTTQGTINSADGDHAYGVYNGSGANSSYPGGGAASLTDVTVQTFGATSSGVVTANGGATTLTGTNVTTAGVGAVGVESTSGGVTNMSGGSVLTANQDAHAVYATGARSTVNLSGSPGFSTAGAGAIGLYAALGGVISATGPVTISTAGGVSPATSLGAYGVNADGAGSQIKLGAATITTSGPGAFGLLASDAASSGSAGVITATGTLNVKTTNAAATAVGLEGNGASILATGGGTIASAGGAIAFSGGTNQTATFDNFTINNQSGDLVLADPSVSTVNFNNTTANAGTNYLLYATGAGTAVTMNANASALTGAIQTIPGATSNVNLANGTTWNLTGPSTVTNLSVTNSVVVFAPPSSGQAFKTLTVTNYVGAGANITMNATLGGSNSASDEIIVNGGKTTGTTALTVKNVGGLGGQTTGSGIPLVTTTNGGTVAPGAFDLANTPVVGGFKYSLDETNGEWYLVSSATTTQAQVQSSINTVAKAQQNQIITNRVLGSILLGATEQISCSSCGSGFGSIGSLALGAHGRWGLSDQLTAMGGISYNQWTSAGISVYDAPTVAGSLVYDFSNLGSSRPFIEAGGGLTPYEQVKYSRNYPNGYGTALGTGTAVDRDLSLFARVGWLARLSPIDEAAIYGDLSRNWMQTGGYSEATTAINPYPETVPTGLDTLNVARIGGQLTHLFNGNIEVNVSGGIAYGFGAGSGSFVNVYDFGPIAPNALPNTAWFEYGARVGYRFNDRLVVDAFVIGTAGGEVGTTVHGGIGLRYSF